MKKTLLTVLLATASAVTFADGSFTGAGLEVGAGVTKSRQIPWPWYFHWYRLTGLMTVLL